MEGGVTSLDVFDIASVKKAFAERPVSAQPRPVEKRAQPKEEDDDDEIVYAVPEDVDDANESWLDVMKDLEISPSKETVRKEKTKGKASKGAKKKGKGGKKKK